MTPWGYLFFGVILLGACFMAYASGWTRCASHTDDLMASLRNLPDGVGPTIWNNMVVMACDERRITMAEVVASDLLAWSKLSEDERKLITAAAHATFRILHSDHRRRLPVEPSDPGGPDTGAAGSRRPAWGT